MNHKEKNILALRLYKILDLIIISISFILALFSNKLFLQDVQHRPILIANYLWLLFIILPLFGVIFLINDLYSSQRGKTFKVIIGKIIKSNLEGVLCLGLIFFIFKIHIFTITLISTFIILCTFLLILEKLVMLTGLKFLRRKGRNSKYVLIIGTGRRSHHLIQNIMRDPESGFKIVGCLDIYPNKIGKFVAGVKILGTSDMLSEVLHNTVIDEVFIALPFSKKYISQTKEYLIVCQDVGVNSRIVTDLYNYREIFHGKIFIDEIFNIPLISLTKRSDQLIHLYVKSTLDFMIALLTLIILTPLMVIIAVIIKLTSPGPVIFKQERSGLNGRRFILYKFRTMIKAAESLQPMLRKHNEMSWPVFKISNDKRITPFGKILRRTSMDELPQFFNVLIGCMSLVGPRPLPVNEAMNIEGSWRRRFSMKPGITGIWQVNGRNNIDFDKWMKIDLEYVDNWSLRLDFKTLLKTIPAVINGIGAK